MARPPINGQRPLPDTFSALTSRFNLHRAAWLIAAIPLFYVILKRWYSREDRCRFLPLAFFALSPAAVLWSQMVKSYSLLTLLVLVSTHSITNPFLRAEYTFFYFIFGETLFPVHPLAFTGAIIFLFFFIRGVVRVMVRTKEADPLLISAFLALSAGMLTIFMVAGTIPQNLVHLQPFFLLLVAEGTCSLRGRRLQKILPVLLVLFLLPSLVHYYRGNSRHFHDVSKLVPYRAVSRMMAETEQEKEVILFTGRRDERFAEFFPPCSPWEWYYRGRAPLVNLDPSGNGDPAPRLSEFFSAYERFWVLLHYGDHLNWNQEVKDFFFGLRETGELVTIEELRLVPNRSFLAWLSREPKPEYHFLEVYSFQKR